MDAKYKCESCGHIWTENFAGPDISCTECGHLYVIWINYEELAKNYRDLDREGLEKYAFGG